MAIESFVQETNVLFLDLFYSEHKLGLVQLFSPSVALPPELVLMNCCGCLCFCGFGMSSSVTVGTQQGGQQ